MSTRVIGNVWYPETFIGELFDDTNILVTSPNDVEKCDLLVFWGGEDINTKFYGEKNVQSHASHHKSDRDKFEQILYQTAVGHVPMLGICRGAQLLCALGGGKLWQHVDNHGTDHPIQLPDKSVILVTSTHHQMMRPSLNMEVLAVSPTIRSPFKYNESGKNEPKTDEPEIVFDPVNKALMIQGHPEYPHASKNFVELTKNLIRKYLV